MFDHPVCKVICWILLIITVFGGINYFFIAQNKDLVPKISSSTNGRKALYYTIAIASVLFFVFKLVHHHQMGHAFYY
jgi:hypothetical protein